MKTRFPLILRLIIVISLLQSLACKRPQSSFQYNKRSTSSINISIDSLDLDTIHFDSIPSSYIGKFLFDENRVLFIDQMFGYIFAFDNNGKFLNKYLGKGKGPSELPTRFIAGIQKLSDKTYLVLGPSYDFYLFDSLWIMKKRFLFEKNISVSESEMYNNPKPDMQGIYDIEYERNMNIQEFNGDILLPAECLLDNFNPVMKSYYEHARIFFRLNLSNGKVIELLGKRPPSYLNYHFIGQFSWFDFEVTPSNNIYLSFEPDSLIYTFDSDLNLTKVFGYSGKDMNTDYFESRDLDETGMMLYEERINKGYYTHIKVFEDKKLVFRSYQKGSHSKSDGLQIYHKNILIGDVDVPEGFKILGYSAPYFYSEGVIDEENEEIEMYRFKLTLVHP